MHNGTLCKQSVSILYYLIIDQLCYNQPIHEGYVDDWSLARIWGDIFSICATAKSTELSFLRHMISFDSKVYMIEQKKCGKEKKVSEIEKLLPFEEAQMEKVW